MVCAVDAAVRCADCCAIYGAMQHAVCGAVCGAVYDSEQCAVSRPISYAFWCTMI